MKQEKISKKIRLFAILLISFLGGTILSESKNIVYKIVSKKEEKFSKIEIFTLKKNKKENISIIKGETFIDIKIKDTKTNEPGKFYDSTIPFIQKIASYLDNEDLIIRLFSSEKAEKIALHSEIISDYKKIILKIKNNAFIKNANQKSLLPPKKIEALGLQKKSSFISLDDSLWKATFVSFLLIFFFLIFISIQKLLIQRRSAHKNEGILVLSNISLGGKYRLSLVSVGEEKLLLAIN